MNERLDAADDVRRLFAEAVPALPDPPDRIGSVRRRVIRSRTRRGAAAAFGVALLVAAGFVGPRVVNDALRQPTAATTTTPSCVLPPPESDQATIPDEGFVLPPGAIRLALCYHTKAPADERVLTTGVDQMIDRLNALPDKKALDELRRAAAARGEEPAFDKEPCPAYQPPQSTFVVHYPDRAPVLLRLDFCGAFGSARHDGRWRFFLRDAMVTFFSLYRAQLAAQADPASLRAQPCAGRFDIQPGHPLLGGPGIASNRGYNEPFLPSELAAVTVCRYAVDQNRRTRLVAEGQADPAHNAAVRRAVNAVFAGGPPVDCRRMTLLDQVIVVDVTGARDEVIVARRPCQSAGGRDAVGTVPGDLIPLIDGVLGPPR